jgi:hypothetical protein
VNYHPEEHIYDKSGSETGIKKSKTGAREKIPVCRISTFPVLYHPSPVFYNPTISLDISLPLHFLSLCSLSFLPSYIRESELSRLSITPLPQSDPCTQN